MHDLLEGEKCLHCGMIGVMWRNRLICPQGDEAQAAMRRFFMYTEGEHQQCIPLAALPSVPSELFLTASVPLHEILRVCYGNTKCDPNRVDGEVRKWLGYAESVSHAIAGAVIQNESLQAPLQEPEEFIPKEKSLIEQPLIEPSSLEKDKNIFRTIEID